MDVSTDGIICYSLTFDEGTEFPWDATLFDGDEEDWWLKQRGFKPTFYPFNEENNYAPGVKEGDPRIDAYFKERRQFKKDFGEFPFALVNFCSGDCPMYAFAVKSSIIRCSRGYPAEFNPKSLVFDDGRVQQLLGFCDEYGLLPEKADPKWLLCSFWG